MSSKKIKAAEFIPGQMALQLPVDNFVTREDLVEGQANFLALELIDGWPDWPGLVVVLAGPVGSGKSHIGAAWVRKANARCVSMSNLDELGEDRANGRPLLLEDARVNCIDETELFHILNAKRSEKAAIIITSRSWPDDWGIVLDDLNSRLRAAQLVELEEPDDALLRKVLFKLFADRQLPVDPLVINYLVVRMERSLDAALQIVSHLDSIGLAQQRKITRQLAAEVLANMEAG